MYGRVLIIDDEKGTVITISKILQRDNIDTDFSLNMKDGLDKIDSNKFDIVLLDVNLPDGSGIESIKRILDRPFPPQVIIMTGYSHPDGALLAIESGAWDYLKKPISPKDLRLQISRALQYQQQKKKAAGRFNLVAPEIIGSSNVLRHCMEQSAQIANSDANVLITGETGTGKELFARAIHANNSDRNGDFVVVDCSILSGNLIESVLFGHKKGAFTGADRDRKGLVALADGGTLFMDEVGELPESIQSSFLRVMQEKRFRPMGSEKEVFSDFRVICATNKNLDRMTSENRFRPDLLYRLKAFTLHLPPLREREGDIELIARHQLSKSRKAHCLPGKEISPDFLEALEKYHWPGNIRELINAIEAALIASRHEDTLFAYHLPVAIRAHITHAKFSNTNSVSADLFSATLPLRGEMISHKEIIERTEKQYLEALKDATGGDIQQMIKQSDLSRTVLYRKMKKYNIR